MVSLELSSPIFAALSVFLFVTFVDSKTKLPDYITKCPSKDPNLEKCVLNLIEKIRPHLKDGIPELGVPVMEPLVIPEVHFSRGNLFKANGKNVNVYGGTNFKVRDLKIDMQKNVFLLNIFLPKITFDADYDVNAQIIVPIKGRGPMNGDASKINGDALLKGKRYKKEGETYLKFVDLTLDIDIGDYNMKLRNLFNGNKALNDNVNFVINDNKDELKRSLKPLVQEVISKLILDLVNSIFNNFSLDDVLS
uniref:Circadian clock-controlled protein n=1 Tax=Cacopsylla melanoneura TaxID=428564 RepID=A0A8D8ZW31_9HEMI